MTLKDTCWPPLHLEYWVHQPERRPIAWDKPVGSGFSKTSKSHIYSMFPEVRWYKMPFPSLFKWHAFLQDEEVWPRGTFLPCLVSAGYPHSSFFTDNRSSRPSLLGSVLRNTNRANTKYVKSSFKVRLVKDGNFHQQSLVLCLWIYNIQAQHEGYCIWCRKTIPIKSL